MHCGQSICQGSCSRLDNATDFVFYESIHVCLILIETLLSYIRPGAGIQSQLLAGTNAGLT
jgi:hypothetical protein